ncbi:MAG: hypothetical protein R6U43_06315 [Candidatus Krumholzibacteriales bacterium]
MKAIGIILMVPALLLLAGCGEDAERPGDGSGAKVIEVTVLELFISANLMPMYPPDPIDCHATLAIDNSAGYRLSGLSVPSAGVYLSEGDRYLGEFRFSSGWDGILEPGEVDTISVVKVQESSAIFEPPCGELLYLKILLDGGLFRTTRIKTGDSFFACVY